MPSVTIPAPGATALATATNAIVAAAPLIPGNEMGAGGIEVNLIALALNGIGQVLKMFEWFNQNKYLPLVLLFCGIGIGILATHADWRMGLLNGLASLPTALNNYSAMNKAGNLPAGTEVSHG